MVKTIDQQSIRRQNMERIWELFTAQAVLTRQDLAEGTGLSLMTVTNLVDQLKRCHVLSFSPPVPQTGPGRRNAGRKADQISLCKERHAWIIVDLTELHFRFCALALDLSCIYESAGWAYDVQRAFSLNLRAFLRKAREIVEKKLRDREILGVAVVVPGPYDVVTDTVTNKRLPELNTLSIKQTLRDELGLYDYYVDEDVKFAVRAYLSLAAQNDSEVLYYAYIGEGVGGATIHNGNVLRGLNAAAGDVGQLLDRDGRTFESKLSLRVFAQACGLPVEAADDETALLARIAQCMREDFPRYQEALLRAAEGAGDMLYSIAWLLDPGQIVVDCPYAIPYQELFAQRVRQRLTSILGGSLRQLPQVLTCPYEMRSVLYGAVQVLSREWIARIA